MKKIIVAAILALSLLTASFMPTVSEAAPKKQKPKSGRQIFEEGKQKDKAQKAEAKRVKQMYKEGKISKATAKARLQKIDNNREKTKQQIRSGKQKMKEGK